MTDDEVTLIDEAGVERRFKLHDAFDLDGVAYYLVEDGSDRKASSCSVNRGRAWRPSTATSSSA